MLVLDLEYRSQYNCYDTQRISDYMSYTTINSHDNAKYWLGYFQCKKYIPKSLVVILQGF